MGYSAKAIANHFLSRFGKHGITPLKIQKLVYLAHGWHLAFYDAPLIDDEYAEAWQYGPIFASLYHEFKYFGQDPVMTLAEEIDLDLVKSTPRIQKHDTRTRTLLDQVWDAYGKYNGIQLSGMCHEPDSPWARAREKSGNRMNANIDDEEIKQHYKAHRARNLERTASGSRSSGQQGPSHAESGQ